MPPKQTHDPSERTPLLASPPQPLPSSAPAPTTDTIEAPASTTNGKYPTETQFSSARLALIISGIYPSAFTAAIDSTLVATLASPISTQFHSLPLLSWLASAYFIASGVCAPLAGRITDIFGRKAGLLFANTVFTLGNIICALAQNQTAMVVGRVVAGIGGGFLGPSATFFVADVMPLRSRGAWMGTVNVFFSMGSALGGPIGGLLQDTVGWRWAFWGQVPISAVAVTLILLFMDMPLHPSSTQKGDNQPAAEAAEAVSAAAVEQERTVPHDDEPAQKKAELASYRNIDYFGALFMVLFMASFLLATSMGGIMVPWTSPIVLTALPLSLCFLVLFILVERSHPLPILPPSLLANRTVLAGYLGLWFTTMSNFGIFFFVPIYYLVLGYSASAAGVRFLPYSIVSGFTSFAIGLWVKKTGRYYNANLVGAVCIVIGSAMVATFSLHTPVWLPFVAIAFMGIGYGGMITTCSLAFTAAVPQKEQAIVTSGAYIFRTTGTVIGIAMSNAILQACLGKYLRERIGGLPGAEAVIREVRNSIGVIKDLPGKYQHGVRAAYVESLQVVFFVLLGMAALGAVCSACMEEHKMYKTLARDDEDED